MAMAVILQNKCRDCNGPGEFKSEIAPALYRTDVAAQRFGVVCVAAARAGRAGSGPAFGGR
jgi:hypothetical protein